LKHFEAIVVGAGAHGSSATYNLAKRGVRTLNLEKFELNHKNGSSHGDSRQITKAYFTNTKMEPHVTRSFKLWHELEKESNEELVKRIGAIYIGASGGKPTKTTESMDIGILKKIPSYKVFSSRELNETFPVFNPNDDEEGVLEPDGGIIFPEKTVAARLRLAREYGAEVHFNDPLLSWHVDGGGKIVVRTATESYSTDKIAFCSGGWTARLLSDLKLPLQCERQYFFRFQPIKNKEMFSSERLPTYIWPRTVLRYGFPDLGAGVKVAIHHEGRQVAASPDEITREVTPDDEKPLREFVRDCLPWADGPGLARVVCVYTNTPDRQFLLDFHPKYKNVLIVSPCSGEGFQHSPFFGEAVADLFTKGRTSLDISIFNLERLKPFMSAAA